MTDDLSAADVVHTNAALIVAAVNALPDLLAYVRELEREQSTLRAALDEARDEVRDLTVELARARAERDATRADAERYRWLRDNFRDSNWTAKFWLLNGAKFDAAIDDARAKVRP